jgi:superfamily II DNA/RNA helicase
MASGDLKMPHLEHLILDEADRMLDMGFYDDILRIISYLPKKRQTLLFSATMPPKIRTLAQRILENPEQINIAIAKPAEGIVQQVYKVGDPNKLDLIKNILDGNPYKSIIIFASTKEKVKQLDHTMRKAGFQCKAFHSDLQQPEREALMREFKDKLLPMLIGTDVLSRGIDVEGIDLVVNYDVPPDPEDYVHRIGRTARAERTGTAITFVNPADHHKLRRIEDLTGLHIPVMHNPEGIPAASMSHHEMHGDKRKKKQFNRNRNFRKGRGGENKPK